MQKKKENFQDVWSQVVVNAWNNPQLKKELIDNPKKVLKSHGITIAGKDVTITENTVDTLYLILPEIPADTLLEENLTETASSSEYACNLSQSR